MVAPSETWKSKSIFSLDLVFRAIFNGSELILFYIRYSFRH